MPTPSIKEIIAFSWRKTKEILFPFQFKRWFKILFIVWLSGQGAGGIGGNDFDPQRWKKTGQEKSQTQSETSQSTSPQTMQTASPAEGAVQVQTLDEPAAKTSAKVKTWEERLNKIGNMYWESSSLRAKTPILFSIPLLFILILLFVWLSARFNFIFLEFMVRREVRVGETFRKFKMLGNSLFFWETGFLLSYGFLLLSLFLFGLYGGALFILRNQFVLFALFGLLLFAGIVLMIAVGNLVSDFILAVMYRDGIKTFPALKKFFNLKPRIGQILLYFLVKIGLAILALLAALAVTIAVGLAAIIILVIMALLLALAGWLLTLALPFLMPVLIACGVTLIIAAIVVLLIAIGLATLPIPIFFRAFSLAWLARMLPEYDLLNLRAPEH